MKKYFLLLVVSIVFSAASHAQDIQTAPAKQFMQITTVESVLAGGLGRSKMIITNADGTQKETDLENLFSLVGINFKNIKQNDDKVMRTIKEYNNNGWKTEHVTSLTLSQNDSGAGGIFMTRYLLSKAEEKKG
jgi:uncharacterized protein YcfL